MIGSHFTLILAATLLADAGSSSAQVATPPPRVYTNGFKVALELGSALYETLDQKFQKCLQPEPVAMEIMDAPVITPAAVEDGSAKLGQVVISAGYLDLLNHVAHAKAIDRIQPGYFGRYASLLAREKADDTIPELMDMVDARYWSLPVMNDQMSYFNQMVGLTVAINLSHHYLGHYNQHVKEMLAGSLVPINDFIASDDWEASIKDATLNSLDTGLATAGPRALFEAIDKMPRRPAWTAYLAPTNADLKILNQHLAAYETNYWRGQLSLAGSPATASK